MSFEPDSSGEAPTSQDSGTVSVVVVTHRGQSEMLQRCLDSVEAAGGFDHLIVVDNSGRKESPTTSDASPGGVWLRVDNDGFGAAFNSGAAAARRLGGPGQFIAALNDDTSVVPGWLTPLGAALADGTRVGAVQPKLVVGGSVPRRINSVGVQLDQAGAGSDVGLGECDGPEWNTAGPIEIFSGGAVLFSDDFLRELGGFDERYFLYYEDVDLALRGAERGWTYRYVPSSRVEHWAGSTTSTLGDELRRLQERNRIWVAFRFGSFSTIRSAVWLSIRRLRHPPRLAHARGLAAGLFRAPAMLFDRLRARSTAIPDVNS